VHLPDLLEDIPPLSDSSALLDLTSTQLSTGSYLAGICNKK
jgi:hypothetical protein